MSTLTDRIAVIIDAKSGGAVNEFRKTGAAADQLGKRADVLKARVTDLDARLAKAPGNKKLQAQLKATRAELDDVTSKLQPLTAGSSKADRAVQRLGLSSAITGAQLKAGVAAGATAGAFAIGAFLKASVTAASDLSESQSKVQVVFGSSADAVLKWGDSAATAMGQSRQQALEAASTLGNLFVSMRIGQGQAAQMSTRIVQLAGDLASFNNADPTEVLEALRSGLVGETEPLRRFGVNLNDAALRAEVMRLGLGKVGPTLTAQQKTMASYSLILQQTKTAQGDYARTSDGLANTTRTLQAEMADLQATVGEDLLPAMASFAGALATVVGAADDAMGSIGGLGGAVKGLVYATPVIGQIAWAQDNFGDKTKKSTDKLNEQKAAAQLAGDPLRQVGGAAGGAAKQQDKLATAADRATAALKKQVDQTRASIDPAFAMLQAIRDNQSAQADYNQAVKEHGRKSDEARAAQLRMAESALDLKTSAIELRGSLQDGTVAAYGMELQLKRWEAQGLLTAGTADNLSKQLNSATNEALRLSSTPATAKVKTQGVPKAKQDLDDVKTRLDRIDKQVAEADIRADINAALLNLDDLEKRIAFATRDRHVRIDLEFDQRTQTGNYTSSFEADPSANKSKSRTTSSSEPSTSANKSRRAAGGRVYAGAEYTVGERGPEQWVPNANGSIVSHNRVMGASLPVQQGTTVLVYLDSEPIAARVVQTTGKAAAVYGRVP